MEQEKIGPHARNLEEKSSLRLISTGLNLHVRLLNQAAKPLVTTMKHQLQKISLLELQFESPVSKALATTRNRSQNVCTTILVVEHHIIYNGYLYESLVEFTSYLKLISMYSLL